MVFFRVMRDRQNEGVTSRSLAKLDLHAEVIVRTKPLSSPKPERQYKTHPHGKVDVPQTLHPQKVDFHTKYRFQKLLTST